MKEYGFIQHCISSDGISSIYIMSEYSICRIYWYEDYVDEMYITDLSTEEQHRRKGHGNKILQYAEKTCVENNATRIILLVKKCSFMEDWYKRHGYKYMYSFDEYYNKYIKDVSHD